MLINQLKKNVNKLTKLIDQWKVSQPGCYIYKSSLFVESICLFDKDEKYLFDIHQYSYTMKQNRLILCTSILCLISWNILQSQTVTDIDGNVYNTIAIGEQTWMQENLKTTHFADGSPITGTWFYNNDTNNLNLYGMFYNWDAAMHYTIEPGAQGACMDGWHLPTHDEWTVLGTFLGGDNVAGGKMKTTGTTLWLAPNTGATNSSEFNGLPAGEIDGTVFQFIRKAAVFWSSTKVGNARAKYRYLSNDDAELHTYTWYKSLGYSIRCVKDSVSTGVSNTESKKKIKIFPNPASDKVTVACNNCQPAGNSLSIYNSVGKRVAEMTFSGQITIDISDFTVGLYVISINGEENVRLMKQ